MTEEEAVEMLPKERQAPIKSLLNFKPGDLPEKPEKNTWYTYRPEGCICSDGSPYYSTLKIGTENKLMVMFIGGGVAIDAYSAARPNSFDPKAEQPTFYLPTTLVMGYLFGHSGIGNKDKADNPFKNWSVVVISYASGDFHCGTNSFEYDDKEKGKGVCHHHGYINYRAMMKKIKEFVPNPEQVMVTGYSAGGFASELLTDDVMSIYDKCDNFVCLADSGIACNDWHSVAVNEWGAPKEICDRLKTDNLALDCLLDLHRKHGNRVKVMLGCTYRDALLAQEQLYCDGHPFDFTKEAGDRFQAILKDTVETLINEIPDVSIYIFDRKNAEVTVGELTDHTFIATDTVFDYSYEGVKLIDWIYDGVCGKPQKIGLKLLDKKG